MNMHNAAENEMIDDEVLGFIASNAKPTITLNQLRVIAASLIQENTLKMSLGRLWRSVRILRSNAANGQVLYWTENTARAVAASGVSPDMPPGIDIPEIALIDSGVKEKREEVISPEIENFKNDSITRGTLLPTSSLTALEPIRILNEGRRGALHRGAASGRVAMAMFKYRDCRMSVDAIHLLCPGVKREDISRVLTQLSTEGSIKYPQYFKRFGGARSADRMYQWSFVYNYPHSTFESLDGMDIKQYGATKPIETAQFDAPETQEEIEAHVVSIDEIPPEELSEGEVNSEIARLLGSPVIHDQTAQFDAIEADPVTRDLDTQSDALCVICDNSKSVNIEVSEPKIAKQSEADFLAGMFTDGELFMKFADGSQHILKKDATDKLMKLLGPMYLAQIAGRNNHEFKQLQ